MYNIRFSLNFSPFSKIVETKTYPFARTLRTSFYQKLKDCYEILAGDLNERSWEPHVGLFDYFTLFIPLALDYLLQYYGPKIENNLLFLILLIPILIPIDFLILRPLDIARKMFALVFTILFLPLIALVHVISLYIAGNSYKEAFDLKVEQRKYNDTNTLDIFFNPRAQDINNSLDIDVTKNPESNDDPNSTSDNQSTTYLLKFFHKGIIGESDDEIVKLVVNVKKGEPQAKNIHALFRLNIGNVVSNIEKGKSSIDPTIFSI